MSRNATARTGAHVTVAPSGCGNCGHPLTLHSNGKTACKAAGCTAGTPAECPSCHGTTVSLLDNQQCTACNGRGVVPQPCAGFTVEGQARPVPELLAS